VEEDDPVHLPIDGSLDLHTFVPKDIPSVVNDYIYAAHATGLREVRLVHGRGQGIQRGIVQRLLDNHPLVAEFFDDADSHLGATIALLVP
jgi:DNA-nicking Smr family endonuclease